MKDRVICIHCLEELDPNLSRCSHCGNGTTRSKGVYSYIKRCEQRGTVPTADFIARRYNVYLSSAQKILSAYYDDNLSNELMNRNTLNTRIKKIRVSKLFNYLDYEIDLHDDFSIILAPNGFGKTTIFNFVNFILNPYIVIYDRYIKGVPFESFEIELEDGKSLSFISQGDEGEYIFRISNLEESEIIRLPYGDEADERDYSDDVVKRNEGIRKMVEMLNKASIYSDVFFIKTSRAFETPLSKNAYGNLLLGENYTARGREQGQEERIDPMQSCNFDLISLMDSCKKEYQKLTEKVKNSLPEKFLKMSGPLISPAESKAEWNKYKNRLNELSQYGLIDAGNVSDFVNNLSESEYSDVDNGKGAFLSLYVTEYKKTLEPFVDLYQKMKTFREIINERNFGTKKHIEYTNSGIEYYNGKQKIRLESLSSGERNDFIMFFDMIFRTGEGSIILIDEPEISLHINWQEKYIDNIEKALADKKCQVIISTHSPDIISSHDDYIVELKLVSETEEGSDD